MAADFPEDLPKNEAEWLEALEEFCHEQDRQLYELAMKRDLSPADVARLILEAKDLTDEQRAYIQTDFGEQVHELRLQKGWAKDDMEAVLFMEKGEISLIEEGQGMATFWRVCKMSRVFEMKVVIGPDRTIKLVPYDEEECEED